MKNFKEKKKEKKIFTVARLFKTIEAYLIECLNFKRFPAGCEWCHNIPEFFPDDFGKWKCAYAGVTYKSYKCLWM